MSKSLGRVRSALEAAGLTPDIREMPEEVRTAQQAADAIGCELDQIAKSIVLRAPQSDRIALFITAGGNRVDSAGAESLVGEPMTPADASLVRARTGFVIGGVAPIGHLSDLPAFFDQCLLEFELVWAAAGTPRHVFSIEPHRLLKISGAQLSDSMRKTKKM